MLFERMFLRAFCVGSVLNNTSNSPFLQHSRNRTRDCYFCLFLFSFFFCFVIVLFHVRLTAISILTVQNCNENTTNNNTSKVPKC